MFRGNNCWKESNRLSELYLEKKLKRKCYECRSCGYLAKLKLWSEITNHIYQVDWIKKRLGYQQAITLDVPVGIFWNN